MHNEFELYVLGELQDYLTTTHHPTYSYDFSFEETTHKLEVKERSIASTQIDSLYIRKDKLDNINRWGDSVFFYNQLTDGALGVWLPTLDTSELEVKQVQDVVYAIPIHEFSPISGFEELAQILKDGYYEERQTTTEFPC